MLVDNSKKNKFAFLNNRVDVTGAFRLKKALFLSHFVRKLVMQLRLHSHFPALWEEKMSIFLH